MCAPVYVCVCMCVCVCVCVVCCAYRIQGNKQWLWMVVQVQRRRLSRAVRWRILKENTGYRVWLGKEAGHPT